jgi:hypothetical protein
MPLKIKSPIEKDFLLEKSDEKFEVKDEPTMVRVKQATQGAFELRNQLFDELRREFAGPVMTVVQRISFDAVRRREVWLTLVSSNIVDSQTGGALFNEKTKDNEMEFSKAWATLDPFIADEIHQKVLEMNPLWDESGEASSQTDSQKSEKKSKNTTEQ